MSLSHWNLCNNEEFNFLTPTSLKSLNFEGRKWISKLKGIRLEFHASESWDFHWENFFTYLLTRSRSLFSALQLSISALTSEFSFRLWMVKKNCSLKSFLLSWMCRFTIIIYLRNVQKWEDQPGWSSPQAQRTISTFCLHEKQKCFLCCLGSGCLRRFQVG